MKTLNKEEIQIISTYLSNADINFEDIRVEMIDHVASAIEEQINNGDDRDFYDLFKEFMVHNKNELEKRGNRLTGQLFKSVAIRFFKNMYHWQVVVGAILCYLVFDMLDDFLFAEVGELQILALAIGGLLISIPFLAFGKKRMSFIACLATMLYLFFYLNSFLVSFLVKPSFLYTVNLALLAVMFTCGFKTMFELIIHYKRKLQLA